MPDLDDFYVFINTSEDNHSSSGGCLGRLFKWGLIILVILWVVGKLSG